MAGAAEIIHEVETAYQTYAAAFNHGDMDRVVQYVSAPYLMTIGGNAPMIAPTEAARDQLFHRQLDSLKSRGWSKSDFKIVRVWPLSNDHALLMTDITRFKTDGSVMETGRYCYMLRRAAPSWQITGVTDVAPPFLGPGDFPRG
jgi:hypothetical protein